MEVPVYSFITGRTSDVVVQLDTWAMIAGIKYVRNSIMSLFRPPTYAKTNN